MFDPSPSLSARATASSRSKALSSMYVEVSKAVHHMLCGGQLEDAANELCLLNRLCCHVSSLTGEVFNLIQHNAMWSNDLFGSSAASHSHSEYNTSVSTFFQWFEC